MEVPQSHLWVGGVQATRDANLEPSRGAGGIRGEEVLDRRELPDTLGCPGRALIVELILVRLTILGVSFGRPKTYVALRRQEAPRRKPGLLGGGAGEIDQFCSDRIVNEARRRNAAPRSFGSGPSWTISRFGNRGLGPHSRIAGLLLFPPRPSRGNRLSAATGCRFEWRRNRFACRTVLFWRFSRRPNWRSRCSRLPSRDWGLSAVRVSVGRLRSPTARTRRGPRTL
jgi:hypothetical protein